MTQMSELEVRDIVRDLSEAQKRLIVTIAETGAAHAGTPGYYSGPRPYWNGNRKVTTTVNAIQRRANLIEIRERYQGWRFGLALTRLGGAVYEEIKHKRDAR